MGTWIATVEEALKSKWVVVEAGGMIGDYPAEDTSIATEEGKEVVGCSEWMRAEREVFDHIVALHNASLQNPTGQHPPRLGGGSVAPGCWASESKGK